jgi:hypothetical protein
MYDGMGLILRSGGRKAGGILVGCRLTRVIGIGYLSQVQEPGDGMYR